MRKLQHTLIFAGLVAACLMAGCKKENPSQGTSFTAETEQDAGNAKTGLVGSNIVWRSGDQIQLKNSSSPSQTETLTVAEGTGTNKGKFYTSSSFNLNPPYTATYGVNIDNGAVSLPSTQTLTAANVASPGTIADGLMPMVATSSNNKLPFKNLLGGLCFKVTGSGNLTSIKITSSNTSEKLWGDFTANFANGTMTPTPNGTGSNVLTVNCTGVTLSSTPQYFVVMLPPGSLASNYTVDFTCNGAVITKPATGNADLVQRSKIKTSYQTTNVVPPVTYTVTTAVNNASWGTVSGGGTYQQNATCTVTATPASGYILESWTMNGRDVTWNRSYSLTVNSNVTLTANFVQVPTGALPGLFLVAGSMNNNPRRVWFSQGNLQYNGSSANTWSFATSQWSYLGNDPVQTDETQNRTRDLFCWATSNQPHNNNAPGHLNCWKPWESGNYPQYGGMYSNVFYSYGDSGNSLYNQSDWGYNKITNGGNANSQWRTLSNAEWTYLLTERTNYSNLQGMGTVNDVNGLIILPDNCPYSVSTAWSTLQAAGAVFLPSAGAVNAIYTGNTGANEPICYSNSAYYESSVGAYWSSTPKNGNYVYGISFNTTNVFTQDEMPRVYRCAVRLVKNR